MATNLSDVKFATKTGTDTGSVMYNPGGEYVVNAAEIYWGISAANMPKDVDSMPTQIINAGDLINAIKCVA